MTLDPHPAATAAPDNALDTSSVRTSSSATPNSGMHRGRRRSGVGKQQPSFSIAMNQVETLLLSSAGDVLACHCRWAPHHPRPRRPPQPSCQDEVAIVCCENDDFSLPAQDAALCGGWMASSSPTEHRVGGGGGLRGGAPAEVASPLGSSRGQNHPHHNATAPHPTPPLHPRSPPATRTAAAASPSLAVRAHEAFRSPPLKNVVQQDEDDSIVPIMSFDYSHFQEGGNDMIPDHWQSRRTSRSQSPVAAEPLPPSAMPATTNNTTSAAATTTASTAHHFFHGIPAFVPAFASVRVAQVSAHPDGAHVLCISESGLLYSYGINSYGQLGIGITSSTYLVTPTIVTPLVEHGGKAVACAAGTNHSLVVVQTEERRLYKSQSHPNLLDKATELSVVHHQVYGFGRNDYMKLGLVSPKVKDDIVPLPRRVALHAQVPTDSTAGGIVSVAASVEHSAALVQRPSGAVEVYTWGNATHGALGLPKPLVGLDSPESPVQVVPVPSFCAALSTSPHKTPTFLRRNEEPIQISLGPYTTHVVTSRGRLFACGKSESGILGAGPGVTECAAPHEVELPAPVASIRVGKDHAVATTTNGQAWVWGIAAYCGVGTARTKATSPSATDPTTAADSDDGILWLPQPLNVPDVMEGAAGYDNTVLVQRNGSVWSCGRASGRLGLGEIASSSTTSSSPVYHHPHNGPGGGNTTGPEHAAEIVAEPKRMWGGLELWRRGVKQPPPRKPLLERGATLG